MSKYAWGLMCEVRDADDDIEVTVSRKSVVVRWNGVRFDTDARSLERVFRVIREMRKLGAVVEQAAH